MSDALYRVARGLVFELEARFPYAAALFCSASGVRISDTGREQNASEENPARGAVFTVFDGASFAEYSTSDLEPDRLARDLRAWASGLRSTGQAAPREAARDPETFAVGMRRDPASVPLTEKLAHVRDIQRRAAALDQRIVQARVNYSDRTTESVYIGRGRQLEQRLPRTIIQVLLVASDGAEARYNFTQHGGVAGFELAEMGDEELRATAEVAIRLLEAGHIEPGEYDTISDPSISGVIAHESFGHGVELDLFPKGRARAAQYLNRPVAAPGLQMFDDPTVSNAYGSYFFDDEGERAQPTQILRDGVFVRPISDLASATFVYGFAQGLAKGERTPNGRRQDVTRKTYARMSNTFFRRGATDPASMIADVERGVYLRQGESGVEDPMGWGIQVTAHYAEEIVNGRLTGKLYAPVGITGYVPDLLMSVSAIGNDFELSPGTCGKGYKELVSVSSGGPHLRMRARLG
jgi:TldD protein